MGQSTEELNSQIADTRTSLSGDLDALQDKVSPAAILDRRKTAAKDSVSGLKSKVMGTTQSAHGTAGDASDAASEAFDGSPLAAGLAAFGVGLVIAALVPASKAESDAAATLMDKAKDAGVVEQAKSVGQEIGTNLKDSATDAAQQVKESAQDSVSKVKDEGQSSAATVKEEVPGQA